MGFAGVAASGSAPVPGPPADPGFDGDGTPSLRSESSAKIRRATRFGACMHRVSQPIRFDPGFDGGGTPSLRNVWAKCSQQPSGPSLIAIEIVSYYRSYGVQ